MNQMRQGQTFMDLFHSLLFFRFRRIVHLTFLLGLMMSLNSCGLFESTTEPPKEAEGQKQKDTVQKPKKPPREKALMDTISVEKEVKDSLDEIYPYRFKENYHIAFILPFFENLVNPEENSRKQKIANIAREFYMGSRLALDTLTSCGKNLTIDVYDSRNDKEKVKTIKDKLAEDKPDLIIGPLFTENVKIINDFSAKEKVNMIAPLAYVEEGIKDNPYYISVRPGRQVIAREAAHLINHKFQDDNVFVIRQYDEMEREITWTVDSLIDTTALESYTKIAIDKDKWNTSETLKDTLKAKNNVIFIPSKSEVFTTSVLSGIKALDNIDENDDENDDFEEEVTVIGLSDWLDFGSLNGKTMEKFHMHILSDYHVNYSKASTHNFIKKYRDKYFTEPSHYAIKGYDLSLLAGTMLVQYGQYFQRNWHNDNMQTIHTRFEFEQVRGKRGWQNFYLNTLVFDDFRLNSIDWSDQ